MLEMWPYFLCIATIGMMLVIPAWSYILWRDWWARRTRDRAIRAGRNEPATILPWVDPAKCIGSGSCVRACPEDVLIVIAGQAQVANASACVGHGACVASCPANAIELVFGSERRGVDIPLLGSDFQTVVPGLYIAGELGGMGLIANAVEQGRQALKHAAAGLVQLDQQLDVAIIGAGPAGLSAAVTARELGLRYVVLEQGEFGGAIRHYPRQKLILTRPMDLPGYGRIDRRTLLKEDLIDIFERVVRDNQLRIDTGERVDGIERLADSGFAVHTCSRTLSAQRVLLTVGRRGTPRRLEIPGEDLEKVSYNLVDPELYSGRRLLVVGGGDSAVEAACSLAEQPGTTVTLAYRGEHFSRPRSQNQERLKRAIRARRVRALTQCTPTQITPRQVELMRAGQIVAIENDFVFVCVGGVLPDAILRNAGIRVQRHFGKRVEDVSTPVAPGLAVDPEPTGGGLERAYTQEELNKLVLDALEQNGEEEPGGPVDEVPLAYTHTDSDSSIQETLAVVRAAFSQPVEVTDPLLLEYLDSDIGHTSSGAPSDDPTVWVQVDELRAISRELDDGSPMDLLQQAREFRQLGSHSRAIECFIGAAEARAAECAHAAVVAIATEALPLALGHKWTPGGSGGMSSDECARFTCQLWLLQGESSMAMSDWGEAAPALEKALEQAQVDPDEKRIARCLGSLSRAYYRTGELGDAQGVLNEARPSAHEHSDAEGRATRALADILLRRGEIGLARSHWQRASERDEAAGRVDAYANALIGLARCATAAGDLKKTDALLGGAARAARDRATVHTQAAITLAQIANENAMGWYRPALHRGEELLELEGANVLPHTCVLLGSTLVAIGMTEEAADAVAVGIEALESCPTWDWRPRLGLARLAIDLGRLTEAKALMGAVEDRPFSAEANAGAELSALRARVMATTDPERSNQLARGALLPPHPLDTTRLARTALDCALAHVANGRPSDARSAAKVGLGAAKNGGEGLRLELLVALYEAKPERRVMDAVAATARRVMKRTPVFAAAPFRERPIICDALT